MRKNSIKKETIFLVVIVIIVIIGLIRLIVFISSSKKNDQSTPAKTKSLFGSIMTTINPSGNSIDTSTIIPYYKTTMIPFYTTTLNPYTWAYMNPTFMDCCYSMRLVVPTYTGPVVRLEMDDTTLLDFYTDATQSYMTTGFNNTGTSISSLVSPEIGLGQVRIWYDQSGNGNHAVCNNTSCPYIAKEQISTFNKYVMGFTYVTGQTYLLTLQKAIRPYSICSQFYWNKSGTPPYGTIVSSSEKSGFGVRFYNKTITSEQNEYDWFYQGTGDKYSLLNGSFNDQLLVLKTWTTLCLSVQTPDNSTIDVIGTDTGSSSRSISGYVAEMIFYNKPLTTTEMEEYYNNKFNP
jgi:hypothetical protein